jgi:hypothetical protein
LAISENKNKLFLKLNKTKSLLIISSKLPSKEQVAIKLTQNINLLLLRPAKCKMVTLLTNNYKRSILMLKTTLLLKELSEESSLMMKRAIMSEKKSKNKKTFNTWPSTDLLKKKLLH